MNLNASLESTNASCLSTISEDFISNFVPYFQWMQLDIIAASSVVKRGGRLHRVKRSGLEQAILAQYKRQDDHLKIVGMGKQFNYSINQLLWAISDLTSISWMKEDLINLPILHDTISDHIQSAITCSK